MVDALQDKVYHIDFFQMSLQSTADIPSVESGFMDIVDDDGETTQALSVAGYTREIWKMVKRGRGAGATYAGQFRKFRTSDLPEIGAAGEDAEEIELEADQGLVEKNFFVFYPRRQILAWCRNTHGNTAAQFARFLGEMWSTTVIAGPVLEPDAARRLMSRDITLKRIKLVIPRPANPEMYDDDEFTRGLMQMMNGADADSIHIEMGVDMRRADTSGHLSSRLKTALAHAANLGATSARADVYDEGIEHPIDLIADRVSSSQVVETNAKYPPSGTMYGAIDTAMEECQGQIDEYFGSLDDTVS
jgi:hypothetical protein